MATQEHEQTILNALQPIRDLAKNWDIDIAGCLDEYLDELDLPLDARERVVSSCGLNFAQAALVLQNSSCVYSRKVDYLHSYTFRMQNELLVGQEQVTRRNTRKQGPTDEQVEHFLNYDPHQNFLLLDDVIPMGDDDKINLKEDTSDNDLEHRFNTSRRLSLHTSSRRLSVSSLGSGGNQRRQHPMQVQEGLRLMHTACHIGSDGALYIPGTRNSLEETNSINNNSFLDDDPATRPDFPTNSAFALHDDDGDVAMDMGADYGDDNDHDDGPGFEMADNNDISTDPVDVQATGEIKRVTFAEEPARLEPQLVMDEPDPWEMLDPHEPRGKDRPIRIGKTIQLPSNLVRLPSEGSFPAPPPPRRPSPFRRQPLDPVPFSGPLLGNEFAYIAKATAKRAAEEKRRNRLHAMGTEHRDRMVDENPPEDAFDGNDLGYDDGDDDDDDGGGYQIDGPLESNTGPVDEVFHNTNDHDDFENTGGESKTFEELCRAHVRAFAKGAEKYASETQLATRVRNWQDTLLPQLQLEEQRPVFDIHHYGATVLDNMKENGPTHFSDVTRDCPSYEVCRRFLATLSLCNAGNVRFVGGGNRLDLELLDRSMERPMEQYQAPSSGSSLL